MHRFADIEIDPAKLSVQRAQRLVDLEPKAIRVLLYLIEHRERVVGKEELFEKLWCGVEVTDNALTRVIGQLRKGLGDDAKHSRYIETVPTVGYRFIAALEAKPSGRRQKLTWLALPIFALVSLLILLLFTGGQQAKVDVVAPAVRQLTSSRTLDTGPSLSPDAKLLAYSSDRTGQFEIYIRSVDAVGSEIQITRDGGPNTEAAWSPDGKWIAYHCVSQGGVCMIPATGGTPRLLAQPGSQPAWSPDGKRLLFREAPAISLSPFDLLSSEPRGLAILDLETGRKTSFTDPESNRSAAIWSPDAKWLLYAATPFGGTAHLEALNLSTGKTHELMAAQGLIASLRVSANLKSIFFTRLTKSSSYALYVAPLDPVHMQLRGPARELARTPLIPMQLEISQDARRLVFSAVAQDSNLFRVPIDSSGRVQGPILPVTSNRNFRNAAPVVSPDGAKIAYLTRQFGSTSQIWLANIDGSAPERLSSSDQNAFLPNWTPDGGAVIFSNRGNPSVTKVHLKNRRAEHFALAMPKGTVARYSGRGDDLVLHHRAQGEFRLLLKDFRTGAEKAVQLDSPSYAFAQLSPSGRTWLLEKFERGFTHLATAPFAGGKPTPWSQGIEQAWPYCWSPDERRFSFVGLRQGSWNVFALDTKTGQETKLTDYKSFRTFVRYPSWSPRGDWMVFEVLETTGNLFEVDLGGT